MGEINSGLDKIMDKIEENRGIQGNKKNSESAYLQGFQSFFYMVEVTGFEPATFWSRTIKSQPRKSGIINA